MTLRQARCAFTRALAALVNEAHARGFEIMFDEGLDRLTPKDPTSDHMPGSLHHLGLAQDISLFRDGQWLRNTEDHQVLGEWWEEYGRTHALPLTWGGRWGDGNHYSLKWEGRK